MLGEQPWVERCLSARNADEALALTRRYQPHVALVDLFVGQESGAEICERLRAEPPPPNVLLISGAGPDQPERRARRGRLRIHLQGLAGGRHRGRGADGRARHDRLPPARGAERPAADGARARGPRPDRGRLDQPRDRRAALPLAAHGQGAHLVAVPQAVGAQPGRGGPEGAAARADLVTGSSTLGLGLRALGGPAYINLGHGDDVDDATVDGMERAAHAVLDRAFGAACAGSTRPAPTASRGVPGELAAGAAGSAATTSGSARMGLRLHGRLAGGRRRRTRSRSSPAHSCAASGPRAGAVRPVAAALPDPLGHAGERRAGRPRGARGLDEVRAAGVRIGLSVTGTGQAATIDGALAAGGFDAVQATWNLHERSAEAALARAATPGWRSTSRRRWPTAGSPRAARRRPCARPRGGGGRPPTRWRFAAALAQPWATVVLSGASTVAQLESNLAGAGACAWDGGLDGLSEPAEATGSTRSGAPLELMLFPSWRPARLRALPGPAPSARTAAGRPGSP